MKKDRVAESVDSPKGVGENVVLSRLEMLVCQSGAAVLRNGQVCRMRPPIRRRVLGSDTSDCCYHVMSRTVGAERILDDEDLEGLRIIIRKLALFSGVKVMTYCLLQNHFHLLLRVPDRERFLRQFEDKRAKDGELLEPEGSGEERLMAHLATLYSRAYINQLREELADLRSRGLEKSAHEFLEKYKRRFCDLSLYVKEVKERFSRWYNRKHQRVGTLWSGRFKSVLVEDGVALRTMAAYIDLNPVRAGIVDDPKDYRWCGYAEAVGGSRHARRGLCMVMGVAQDSWRENGARYRCWLMADGRQVEEDAKTKANHVKIRKGIPAEIVDKSLKNKGEFRGCERLLNRMKYLSDGAAIGGRSFVDSVYDRYKEIFGGARKQKGKLVLSDSLARVEVYSLFGKKLSQNEKLE